MELYNKVSYQKKVGHSGLRALDMDGQAHTVYDRSLSILPLEIALREPFVRLQRELFEAGIVCVHLKQLPVGVLMTNVIALLVRTPIGGFF